MNDQDKLEVIKHSFEVLSKLVNRIEKQVKDAREGIITADRNLIMGSLWGIDEAADRIRNVFAVMKYLHQDRG